MRAEMCVYLLFRSRQKARIFNDVPALKDRRLAHRYKKKNRNIIDLTYLSRVYIVHRLEHLNVIIPPI